jgi:hypothetical protein
LPPSHACCLLMRGETGLRVPVSKGNVHRIFSRLPPGPM